jgi:hypothetical protein
VRRLVTLLVLGVIATAATAIAGTQAQPTADQLLRRYAPILTLHPSERFGPVRVDGFLAQADLVGSHYDQRDCRSIDGPLALDCYASADAAAEGSPMAYGAVFRSRERTVLEYWLFYSFDLYSTTDPPGEFWQDHEGDWEAVAVVLDAHAKPLHVATSRHCSGARRSWSRVRRRGTHPLLYVALGSHANYFGTGEIAQDRRCWPPVALAIFDAYKTPVNDHVAAGKTIAPVIVRVTGRTPAWMTFGGSWGETQYVHFPGNAPFAFGFGPVGPAFHALWRRPLATVLSWPIG